MPDKSSPQSRRRPLWETVATLLAIASLWPAYILNLEGPLWRPLCYVMVGVMAVILIRRLFAFERFKEEEAERRRKGSGAGKQGRDRLPWEPPEDDA